MAGNYFDRFDNPGDSSSGENYFDRFDTNKGNSAAGDLARGAAAGGFSALGSIYRGLDQTLFRPAGSLVASGLNSLFQTDFFRAEGPLESSAESAHRTEKRLRDSMSPEVKQAVEDSTPEGSIFRALLGDPGQLSLGKNPSLKGYLYQGVDLMGQFVPQVVAAVFTRGATARGQVAAGAAVGGAQGSGAAYEGARDNIMEMSLDDLKSQSDRFNELVKSGMKPDAAKAQVADESGRWAAALTLPVSALSGGLEGALLGKKGTELLEKMPSRLARAGSAAVVGGAVEGGQEVAEGLTQDLGQNIGAGGDYRGKMEIGQDSFQNLVLGALGGGATGGARGVVSHSPLQVSLNQPLENILTDLENATIPPVLSLPSPDSVPQVGPVVSEVGADNSVSVRKATYREIADNPELQAQRDVIHATGVEPDVEALAQQAEQHAREVARLPAPTSESQTEAHMIGPDGKVVRPTMEEAAKLREQRGEREATGQTPTRVPSNAVPDYASGPAIPNEARPFEVDKDTFQRSTSALNYLPKWAAPNGIDEKATAESIIEGNRESRLVKLANVLDIKTDGYKLPVVVEALRQRLTALKEVVNQTPEQVMARSDLKALAGVLGAEEAKGRDKTAKAVVTRAKALYTRFWDTATAEAHKSAVATAALIHGHEVPANVLSAYPDIKKQLDRQLEKEKSDGKGVSKQGDGKETASQTQAAAQEVAVKVPRGTKAIPAGGLRIKVPVTVEATGETHEVEVDASKAMKRAQTDVDRWKRLMGCLSK